MNDDEDAAFPEFGMSDYDSMEYLTGKANKTSSLGLYLMIIGVMMMVSTAILAFVNASSATYEDFSIASSVNAVLMCFFVFGLGMYVYGSIKQILRLTDDLNDLKESYFAYRRKNAGK